MDHKGTVNIETKRLFLRQFEEKDIRPAFQNWTNDAKVTKYLTWPIHGSIEVTKEVIENWRKNYSDKRFYQWAIVLKEIDESIGSISVVDMNEKVNSLDIGYCIGSKWWNKGYTSEACSAIISFLFEEVKAFCVKQDGITLELWMRLIMEY